MSPHPPESKLPIRRGWRIAGGLALVLTLGLAFWGHHARHADPLGKPGRALRFLTRPDANRPRRSRYPYGLALSPPRAPCSRRVPQDAPLSYPELSLPDIGGLPAAGTLVLTVNNRLARRLTLELAGLLRAERRVWAAAHRAPVRLAGWSRPMSWRSTRAATCPHIGWTASPRRWCGPRRSAPRSRARAAGRAPGGAAGHGRRPAHGRVGAARVPSARTPMNTGRLCPLAPATARPGRAGRRGCEPGLCARAGRAGPGAGWQRRSGLVLAARGPRFAPAGRVRGQGSDIGQWRDARAPAQAASLRGPGSGQRVARRRGWAATQLQAHPTGRYAIVSPQLEAESVFARRVLGQALAGDGARWRSTWPWAGHWMNGRWRARRWPGARAGRMRGRWAAACRRWAPRCWPAIAPAMMRERSRLSAIDARWRRDAHQRVSAQEWRAGSSMAPVLAQAWNQPWTSGRKAARKASCDVWMLRAHEGGPDGAGLSRRSCAGVAYQVMGALGEALGSFRALAPAAGKLGGPPCACGRTATFQPQRDPSARLDAGPAGGRGRLWDGVWVLGLTDDVLPASPKPNPLLPLAVLRQARARAPRPSASANGPKACMRRCAAARPRSLSAMRTWTASASCAVAADRGRRAAGLTPARPAAAEPLPQESLDDRQGPPLAPGGRGGGGLDVLDTQARNPVGLRAPPPRRPRDGGLCRRGRHQRARTVPASRAGTGLGHAARPGRAARGHSRGAGGAPAGTGRGAGRRRDPDRLRPRAQDAGMRGARACWPIGWTWRRGACRSPSRRSRRTSNGSAAR